MSTTLSTGSTSSCSFWNLVQLARPLTEANQAHDKAIENLIASSRGDVESAEEQVRSTLESLIDTQALVLQKFEAACGPLNGESKDESVLQP